MAALGLFAALPLNLLLQFGLGLGIAELRSAGQIQYDVKYLSTDSIRRLSLGAVLFVCTLILWCFFTFIIASLSLDFLVYFLIFPLSVASVRGLDALGNTFFPFYTKIPIYKAESAIDGLVSGCLFLSLRLATGFVEALVIILGFSLGLVLASLIIRDICRRASVEQVPEALRGTPLSIISLGLLSLMFTALSAVLLRIVL
jgi:electron transport complex protein RnfA